MSRKLIALLAVPALSLAHRAAAAQDTTRQAAVAPDAPRPISLQEAVRLARENNVSAITAANQIRTAQNQVRSARAQRLPSLSASLSQNKSAGQRIGPQNTLVDYNADWSYSTSLSSRITLFDAGKTSADVRTQQANVAAAEASQITTEFSLAAQVKIQYNQILAAKEQEAAARAQLALAQQQLAVSIAKVNAGAATVSDSLRNIVAVGNAQLSILNAQQSARSASAALTHLVGTAYFVTATPSDTVDLRMTQVDSASITQMALNGPAIRQSEAQVRALGSAERSAKTSYLPTVSANLGFGGSGTAPYGIGADSDNRFPYNRSIGLSLSYPIFNNFQRENQVAAAHINYENSQAQLRDQKLTAQQNMVTQLGTLRNAEERIRVQQLNVRLNEEDLRVQQQRYTLAAATLLDVLQSQSNLFAARLQLIQARLDYRNARAQIEAIIGQDLP